MVTKCAGQVDANDWSGRMQTGGQVSAITQDTDHLCQRLVFDTAKLAVVPPGQPYDFPINSHTSFLA